MKWLMLVLLTIVPAVSDVCSALPRDLRWTEALSAAHGAVLVRAKKLQDVDEELAVFLFERVETIPTDEGCSGGRSTCSAWRLRLPSATGTTA